ncbi:MAG: endonuclease/exonuclease/phosphatase family protein [Treponema sp.]
MKKFFSSIMLLFLFLSCKEKNNITLVSYNTQTFFDLIKDGREFKEFQNKNWDEESYNERITRLLEAVKICSNELIEKEDLPDILVLEEIESVEVIKDISKRLSNNVYKQAIFIDENTSPFNTAIFSKHKILNAKAHNVYCENKVLRPIIEADLLISIGGKEINMSIFAVHWKSKRDGNEKFRKMQEELLYSRMKEKEKISEVVIACGDFNQNINEFSKMKYFNNAWNLYKNETSINEFKDDEDDFLEEKVDGSYCYKDKWEKLDHIFYSSNSKIKSFFTVANKAPLVYEGKPNRYNINTKKGYSDHLPIGLLLEL